MQFHGISQKVFNLLSFKNKKRSKFSHASKQSCRFIGFLCSNNYFKQVSTHFDQPINQIIDESLQFAAKERSEHIILKKILENCDHISVH